MSERDLSEADPHRNTNMKTQLERSSILVCDRDRGRFHSVGMSVEKMLEAGAKV